MELRHREGKKLSGRTVGSNNLCTLSFLTKGNMLSPLLRMPFTCLNC